VRKPRAGDLPPSAGFLEVSPAGLALTSFRRKAVGGYELRLVETEGRRAEGEIAVHFPVRRAAVTDLLGRRLSEVGFANGKLRVAADPWKILAYELE